MINNYKLFKNQIGSSKGTLHGGDCDPLPNPEDLDYSLTHNLLDLCPEERITIQNKCYEVNSLYEWMITRNHHRLPDTRQEVTTENRIRLIQAYQALNNCNPLPDDVDIISGENLFNLDPIERILIQNKCYVVNSLYEWIVYNNNNVLPGIGTIITPEDRQRLIQAYQAYLVFCRILTRETLIMLYPNFHDATDLDLSDNFFTGIARGTFNNLPRLQSLFLNINHISNLPTNIFNDLLNLKYLDLNTNNITELDQNIFNNLPNLETLDLSSNFIRELDQNIFNNLLELQTLILHGNMLQRLPQNIFNNLSELQILNLANNQIIELEPYIFNNLSELQKLYFDNNQIRNLQSGIFDNLSELMTLRLNNNLIQEIQLDVFNLPRLQKLNLRYNQIREIQPQQFNNLPRLKLLYLDNNQINTIGISDIEQLDYLDNVFNLPRLQFLWLNNNDIVEIQPNIFNFPRLEQLYLNNNQNLVLQQNQYYGLSDYSSVDV